MTAAPTSTKVGGAARGSAGEDGDIALPLPFHEGEPGATALADELRSSLVSLGASRPDERRESRADSGAGEALPLLSRALRASSRARPRKAMRVTAADARPTPPDRRAATGSSNCKDRAVVLSSA